MLNSAADWTREAVDDEAFARTGLKAADVLLRIGGAAGRFAISLTCLSDSGVMARSSPRRFRPELLRGRGTPCSQKTGPAQCRVRSYCHNVPSSSGQTVAFINQLPAGRHRSKLLEKMKLPACRVCSVASRLLPSSRVATAGRAVAFRFCKPDWSVLHVSFCSPKLQHQIRNADGLHERYKANRLSYQPYLHVDGDIAWTDNSDRFTFPPVVFAFG